MAIHTLILYLIGSIILFLILNKVLKITKKITHYTIISCIYILLLSGIYTSLKLTKSNESIFIIILFEMLIRIIDANLLKETNFFNIDNIKRYSILFISAFILNTYFINKVNTVFLNPEQTKIIIWFLIIIYLKDLSKNKENINKPKQNIKNETKNKNEYIIIQYAKLKNKYSIFVKTRYQELIPIIYAIMIYENKNRPELLRKIDYQLYKIDNKGRKYGIMGIYSKYYIDDENSIAITIRRLEKIYNKYKEQKNKTRLIIKDYYNKDNIVNEILYITKEIQKFNQK